MKSQLLDRWGNPVGRAELRAEVAAPTITGIRSPITGYPADGLNPVRLANILREADQGEPLRYLELAETIEERDLHYLGVLGTRRRSVCQIDITVEAASDDPIDVAQADMVRDWLKRDELSEELFDILDSIGKGYSFTEIIWDTSEGQWQPARLEWRDPRWFRFARHDLATPLMLDDHGQDLALPGFKFIYATMKAKSGLALRSGLARAAAWAWMFKAYTQRDWAIFTQTYGQPLRLGKYGAGATEEDKNTLFRAVANIAGDCAAIIPESMAIDFIETKSVGATSDLYKARADWLDQQISKAVLGQTATTDAVTGGLGSGKEHRQVQEDIERADARALAGILNRDLIRPWMQLEFGPQKRYPRLRIERPESEDLVALSGSLAEMIDRGLEIEQSAVRDRFGMPEPAAQAKLMRPVSSGQPAVLGMQPPAEGLRAEAPAANREIKRVLAEIKRGQPDLRATTALQAIGPSAAKNQGVAPGDALADRLVIEAFPKLGAMMEQIEAMLGAANSLEEFREMLLAGFDALDTEPLVGVMAGAMLAAHAAGRVALIEDSAE